MPENINWVVKNWGLVASETSGSDRTTRLEGFGSAVADAVEELARVAESGLLTAHDPDSDFVLGWAEVSPSQVAANGEQTIVGNPWDPDRDIEKLGAVLVRRWKLRERGVLPAHPDSDAAQFVAAEVAQSMREEGVDEEMFISVHHPHDRDIQGINWHEPDDFPDDDDDEW